KFPHGADVEALVKEYRKNSNVEYAEPNYIIHVNTVNDPYYSSSNSWGQGYDDLWGLKKIHAEEAWAQFPNQNDVGKDIVVAVSDTGVDYNHPDLAANIWTNPGEIPGNGIDDDHNGYVDDVHGWNFVSLTSNPMDDHGHGTHV